MAEIYDLTIRKTTQENEKLILSPLACLSENSKGRERPEEPCPIRTCFQRDRDRIIHSSSFRRLKHKTQVFLSPEGDHYRTRLTHTLEVSQIARTIACALRLNCDLTEAIALGHDLGHTPFGHAGERALSMARGSEFHHYEQSVRVCSRLEKEGRGLNLTKEVLNGIDRHTKGEQAFTLEGRIVRLADRIAYINHDIDDAMAAGIISEQDIPHQIREALGKSKGERINNLVTDCVLNSLADIALSDEIKFFFDELHEFMFDNVYRNPKCKSEESKAYEMIGLLYEHFMENPEQMPGLYCEVALTDGLQNAVCDYIAGMTDRYAVKVFEDLYVPKAWRIY